MSTECWVLLKIFWKRGICILYCSGKISLPNSPSIPLLNALGEWSIGERWWVGWFFPPLRQLSKLWNIQLKVNVKLSHSFFKQAHESMHPNVRIAACEFVLFQVHCFSHTPPLPTAVLQLAMLCLSRGSSQSPENVMEVEFEWWRLLISRHCQRKEWSFIAVGY